MSFLAPAPFALTARCGVSSLCAFSHNALEWVSVGNVERSGDEKARNGARLILSDTILVDLYPVLTIIGRR